MRFKHSPKAPWPIDGTIRLVSRFLWCPKRMGGETRWLEWATWEERVVYWVNALTKERTRWSWEPTEWVEPERVLE